MTITPAHTEVTPRTAAATAAKMRKSEERWADHLRGRGWAIIDPDHLPALGLLVAIAAEARAITVDSVWGALGMETPDARV